MKNTLRISALALAFAASAVGAQTKGDDKPSAPTNIPAAVQLATQTGLKVENTFPAAGGLTGWILSEGPGKNIVAFTPADGDVIISGNMLDAKGRNLTAEYMDKYAPKIDYDKFWDRLEKSAWVSETAKTGAKPKKVIYVFKDANCGFCHQAWSSFQPYIDKGLEVRWVMVAILGRDSANKAAALLTAKNSHEALTQLHAEWGKPSSLSATPVTPEIKAKLDANAKLMMDMGIGGTPNTLYKDAAGKVRMVEGAPRPHVLPTITGIELTAKP